MSIESALAAGRAAARARMTSTCAVMRKTGDSTIVGGGFERPEWATVHASLPCRLDGGNAGTAPSSTIRSGGSPVEIGRRTLHIPHDTDDLADGDLVEIATGDTAGMVLRVVEVAWQDQATARRLPVVTAPRPEEWA